MRGREDDRPRARAAHGNDKGVFIGPAFCEPATLGGHSAGSWHADIFGCLQFKLLGGDVAELAGDNLGRIERFFFQRCLFNLHHQLWGRFIPVAGRPHFGNLFMAFVDAGFMLVDGHKCASCGFFPPAGMVLEMAWPPLETFGKIPRTAGQGKNAFADFNRIIGLGLPAMHFLAVVSRILCGVIRDWA